MDKNNATNSINAKWFVSRIPNPAKGFIPLVAIPNIQKYAPITDNPVETKISALTIITISENVFIELYMAR